MNCRDVSADILKIAVQEGVVKGKDISEGERDDVCQILENLNTYYAAPRTQTKESQVVIDAFLAQHAYAPPVVQKMIGKDQKMVDILRALSALIRERILSSPLLSWCLVYAVKTLYPSGDSKLKPVPASSNYDTNLDIDG